MKEKPPNVVEDPDAALFLKRTLDGKIAGIACISNDKREDKELLDVVNALIAVLDLRNAFGLQPPPSPTLQ